MQHPWIFRRPFIDYWRRPQAPSVSPSAKAATAWYSIRTYRKDGVLREYLTAQNNFQAEVDPTRNDDAAAGYAPGSIWVNKILRKVFILASGTVTNADWIQVG